MKRSTSESGHGERACLRAAKAIRSAGDRRIGRIRWIGLKAHLDQCPECTAAFRRMSALVEALDEMPEVNAPLLFAERVLDVVRAIPETGPGLEAVETTRGRRGILLVAGGAVFGVALAVALTELRRLLGKGALGGEADEGLTALGSAEA